MNAKNITVMAIISVLLLFFVNMSLAANTATVTVDTANLRREPNADSTILDLISRGATVQVLNQEGEWYQVRYNNIIGFLRRDLLNNNSENLNQNDSENMTQNTTEENDSDTTVLTPNVNTNRIPEEGEYVVLEDTRLRVNPLITSMQRAEIKQDDIVEVDIIINGWYHVRTENASGWVRSEKLISQVELEEQRAREQAEEEARQEREANRRAMFVNAQTVNVRAEPNTESEILKTITLNTEVAVFSTVDGWSEVEVDDVTGYISSSLLSTTRQVTSRAATGARAPRTTQEGEASEVPFIDAGAAGDVVSFARQFIGHRYVFGGTTPAGFDCSGFTQFVFRNFGINLNRTAAGQFSNGVAVSREQLAPGDLVMFARNGSIYHVGIYIGGGNMVHSANATRGVTIDSITMGSYGRDFIGGRRVI